MKKKGENVSETTIERLNRIVKTWVGNQPEFFDTQSTEDKYKKSYEAKCKAFKVATDFCYKNIANIFDPISGGELRLIKELDDKRDSIIK